MKSINIYDDEKFFKSYNEMPRSRDGLKAAGGRWVQWCGRSAAISSSSLRPDISGR